ncbi:MAG: Flp pilus assembly protein CpaB [Acidimicrobiales bacterium]|nr:Flp pilus assembly protein CpaB [Acidimicrobiales bacterium]
MSQRRTLILAAAIIVGALGAFLVWNYVNNVEEKVAKDAELVSVYLVDQPIARGTSGNEAQAYIKKDSIPRKAVPANAINNPQDIAGKVALNALSANQVVLNDMFVDPSDPNARQSFSERLTRINNEDQAAITIQVDQVRGVASLLQPGDYINIMITQVEDLNATAPLPDDVNTDDILFAQQARYLYQKVEVLAVGQNTVPQAGTARVAADGESSSLAPADTGAARDAGLITVIVPTRAAQYLASVDPAAFYLSLVARDYKPVPQQIIDFNAALPAENPAQLTPYGANGPETTGEG